MIKSDNTPSQYKNKYTFNSMQTLSNDYNVKIIRIYGAAGHGKGLIECANTSDLGMTKEWFTRILIRSFFTNGGPKKSR